MKASLERVKSAKEQLSAEWLGRRGVCGIGTVRLEDGFDGIQVHVEAALPGAERDLVESEIRARVPDVAVRFVAEGPIRKR